MPTAFLTMDDKKTGKKPAKNLITVKIEADVYRLVRTVAAWRAENISDYLSEIVKPIAERDLAKIHKAE